MKKKDSIEEALAGQIPEFEGDVTPKGVLGELRNKDKILGHKADFTEEEAKEAEEFLARQRARRAEQSQASVSNGFVPLDRNELGDRGIFYPSSYEFFIRPATVMAIKNWTAIDDTDMAQVNRVLNEIIQTSVRITDGEGNTVSWNKIHSWDRFWFILKVRELTFTKGEVNIEFEDACSNCGDTITYNLHPQALHFDMPDQDLINDYWAGDSWDINPNEYDVESDKNLRLHIPTVGKDSAILEWAQSKIAAKQTVDTNFVSVLQWLLPTAPKDFAMLDRQIESLYKTYKSWSAEMFEFVLEVIRNISVNQGETLQQTCPVCGGEAISQVRFPDGPKRLFSTPRVKRFGSR